MKTKEKTEKTIVKHVGGYGLSATAKRHLIAVIDANDESYFGRRIKVTNIKMMVEKLGKNKYKVTIYDSHRSMISAGNYETASENIVEVIKK